MAIRSVHLKIAIVVLGALVAITGSVIADSEVRGLDASAKRADDRRARLESISTRLNDARVQYRSNHDMVDLLFLEVPGPRSSDHTRATYGLMFIGRLRELVLAACESADVSDRTALAVENRCNNPANFGFTRPIFDSDANGLASRVMIARSEALFTAFSYNRQYRALRVQLEKRIADSQNASGSIRAKQAFWQRLQTLITGLGILIALAKDLIPNDDNDQKKAAAEA